MIDILEYIKKTKSSDYNDNHEFIHIGDLYTLVVGILSLYIDSEIKHLTNDYNERTFINDVHATGIATKEYNDGIKLVFKPNKYQAYTLSFKEKKTIRTLYAIIHFNRGQIIYNSTEELKNLNDYLSENNS